MPESKDPNAELAACTPHPFDADGFNPAAQLPHGLQTDAGSRRDARVLGVLRLHQQPTGHAQYQTLRGDVDARQLQQQGRRVHDLKRAQILLRPGQLPYCLERKLRDKPLTVVRGV